MKKVIIYSNERGGVSVCAPTGERPIEEVQARDIPGNVQSYIVSADTLPEQDWDFFNAWEHSNGTITVSLDKAKALTKTRLRAERAPLLAAQDVAFQRALESGAEVSAIIAEKNRLRDLPQRVDSCGTLQALRSLSAAP